VLIFNRSQQSFIPCSPMLNISWLPSHFQALFIGIIMLYSFYNIIGLPLIIPDHLRTQESFWWLYLFDFYWWMLYTDHCILWYIFAIWIDWLVTLNFLLLRCRWCLWIQIIHFNDWLIFHYNAFNIQNRLVCIHQWLLLIYFLSLIELWDFISFIWS